MFYNKRQLTVRALLSVEECVSWLQSEGLIAENPLCLVCNAPMKTRVRGCNQVSFRCRRNIAGVFHELQKNALEYTFFADAKISLINVVTIIYYFSRHQTSVDLLVRECSDEGGGALPSIVERWLSHCREACLVWLYNECDHDMALGGPDVLVEVDMCRVGECRYTTRWREGTWVLALIEVTKPQRSGRYRLVLCGEESRDPEVLIPLVARLTQPGTRLDTSLWGHHWGDPRYKQRQYIVNYSQTFVEPVQKINPYSIGALWQAAKRSLKNPNMAFNLAEYLYRREVKLSEEDTFTFFVKALRAPFSVI